MSEFPASRLGELAIAWLRQTWPDAVIVPELSVVSYGGALIDFAAITPTELIGLETKGDGDSHARLPLQGLNYSAVATRMFLLPAPSLHKSCSSRLPPGWHLLSVDETGQIKEPERWRRSRPHPEMPTSPLRLLEMCWAEELRSLARYLQADVMGHRGADALRTRLAETVPLQKLRPAVHMTLRARDWGRAGMRPKKVYRPESEWKPA